MSNPTGQLREGAEQLTVIIPVFNEANTLAECLQRVLSRRLAAQVVMVDDGSSDSTSDVAEPFVSPPRVEFVRHDINRGKGAAIRTALRFATGRFVIIQDADLEYDPDDYAMLLEPLLNGEADVVYGSRYLHPDNKFVGRRRFDWGVWLLNWAVRMLYSVKITDEATCYKVFPTATLRAMDLQCERFEFCPEVTAKACRMGLRIKEIPIRYVPRTVAEGKKIRLRDGVDAIRTLWKYRQWKGDRPSCSVRTSDSDQPESDALPDQFVPANSRSS